MNQHSNSTSALKLVLSALVAGAALLMGAAHAADAGASSYAACASCHGQKAEGNPTVWAPALAGLDAVYLERQLQNFRAGIRGSHADDKNGAVMRSSAASLSDDAIKNVVAYLAKLPAATTATVPAGADLRAGSNYYNGICSACHGNKAEGIAVLNSPRLNQQSADYLVRQFENFRRGIRGGHPQDKLGAQMVKITKAVKDEKLVADVSAYIVQLGRSP